MVPSSGFYATGINKSELKTQELVVAAPRFELRTSWRPIERGYLLEVLPPWFLRAWELRQGQSRR